MKHILFYSENFCGEQEKGGLEIATFRISKALCDTGKYEIYHACCARWNGFDKSVYTDVIQLHKNKKIFEKELKQFIELHDIDVVVNMNRFFRHPSIYKVTRKSSKDIKVIYMHHFAPGSERKKLTYSAGWHLFKLDPLNPLYWLRATIYPIIKLSRYNNIGRIYRYTYDISDRVILLSSQYIQSYCNISNLSDKRKFIAIGNIFDPKDIPLNYNYLNEKKKKVLILCRMDEIQKRMSIALRIWKCIEGNREFHDWQLEIVGSGHDENIVKRLIKKMNLQTVKFHGWRDREPFLIQSSILMVTSEYEGLPLSILEAQFYGCVPIAFNSFGSLKDIISNGDNGVIVNQYGNIKDYAEKLSLLMYNKEERVRIALKCIRTANKYSSIRVAEEWCKMLNQL